MRTFFTPKGLLLPIVVLCSCAPNAAIQRPSGAHMLSANAGRHSVPLVGSCLVVSASSLTDAPIVNHISTALCAVSRSGRVKVRTVLRIDVPAGVQTAELTYTMPNGDELYGTLLGPATIIEGRTYRYAGRTTIRGGSGLFVGAAGELDVQGAIDARTGTGLFTYDGWIAYDPAHLAAR